MDRTVAAGAVATFSVVLADTRGVAFQWMRDGVDITAAVGDSLLLPAVGPADEGRYAVRATNLAGAATSAAAELRLETSPAVPVPLRHRLDVFHDADGFVTVAPMKLDYGPGETVTLTATTFAPGVFLGWSATWRER